MTKAEALRLYKRKACRAGLIAAIDREIKGSAESGSEGCVYYGFESECTKYGIDINNLAETYRGRGFSVELEDGAAFIYWAGTNPVIERRERRANRGNRTYNWGTNTTEVPIPLTTTAGRVEALTALIDDEVITSGQALTILNDTTVNVHPMDDDESITGDFF